jgi:hypothetical protein
VLGDLGRERGALVGADVGRIADDEVEAPLPRGPLERHEPLPLDDLHGRAERVRVRPRAQDGRGRHVDGEDARTGELEGERDRDAAAARPDVGDRELARRAPPRELARAVDQELRLRPRDEHARTDAEGAAVELARARDVRRRLAPAAPHERVARAVDLLPDDRAVERQEQLQPVDPERVRDEQLRLEARRLDALALEELPRHAHHVARVARGLRRARTALVHSAAIRSSRSAASSASNRASSLPARTCSSE